VLYFGSAMIAGIQKLFLNKAFLLQWGYQDETDYGLFLLKPGFIA